MDRGGGAAHRASGIRHAARWRFASLYHDHGGFHGGWRAHGQAVGPLRRHGAGADRRYLHRAWRHRDLFCAEPFHLWSFLWCFAELLWRGGGIQPADCRYLAMVRKTPRHCHGAGGFRQLFRRRFLAHFAAMGHFHDRLAPGASDHGHRELPHHRPPCPAVAHPRPHAGSGRTWHHRAPQSHGAGAFAECFADTDHPGGDHLLHRHGHAAGAYRRLLRGSWFRRGARRANALRHARQRYRVTPDFRLHHGPYRWRANACAFIAVARHRAAAVPAI